VVDEAEVSQKVERVIQMSHKKLPALSSLYMDTYSNTASKVPLPTWHDLYNKIHHEEFQEFTLHSKPEVRTLDDQVFPNIKRSSLYMVASRTFVLPSVETLDWIVNDTDAFFFLINDVKGKCVGVFLLVEVNKYYKLSKPRVRLNTNFMVQFYELHKTSELLASLLRED
jgi:hypothetical protein